MTSSPFLLNATIHKHVEQYQEIDDTFFKDVLKSFYVDDFVEEGKSEDEILTSLKKLKFRFLEGQFSLRKWRTNSAKLREVIQQIEQIEFVENVNKVMGIPWNEFTDEFIIEFKEQIESAKKLKPTKRNILSVLASFYDPLGFVQPLIVSVKLLFQTLCRLKLTWDEEIPLEIRQQWFSIKTWSHYHKLKSTDRTCSSRMMTL